MPTMKEIPEWEERFEQLAIWETYGGVLPPIIASDIKMFISQVHQSAYEQGVKKGLDLAITRLEHSKNVSQLDPEFWETIIKSIKNLISAIKGEV